jgi:nitroimidazol reductase NimA-like FMN-containing flavoprotein (pyridoxamine 5'-phosphate oxidase superfamily)
MDGGYGRQFMAIGKPITELDEPYSSADAKPVPWSTTCDTLEGAGVYWLSTVRPDRRPHVTPVAAVLMDGSLFFSTGPDERKARNLERNAHCILTTGCNNFWEGLDVVVEGDAARTTERAKHEQLTELFSTKYENVFGFRVGDGTFTSPEGVAYVFEVAPVKAFAYERTEPGGATRYRF